MVLEFLEVVMVVEDGQQTVKLKCTLCGEPLTYTNPFQTAKNHHDSQGKVGGCAQRKAVAATQASLAQVSRPTTV
jgi:hypothetical protein